MLVSDEVVSESYTHPDDLRRILDEAYAAEEGDRNWRIFRGPYEAGASTPAVMAWRARTGRSYVDVIGGRDFEFRSWTDPDTQLRYLLVRRDAREDL